MTTYEWRQGAKVRGVEPAVAGRVLAQMARRGPLTAEKIVAKATPESSPLHPAFEWEEAEAARQYRLEQARMMLRSVVVISDTGESTPLLIHVQHEKVGGSAYVTEVEVMADEDLRQAALGDCLRLLNGIRRRYEHLNELRPLWEAMDGVAV